MPTQIDEAAGPGGKLGGNRQHQERLTGRFFDTQAIPPD
jgi:hypothetical protein